MGEPATPSAADREDTRRNAAAIVEAVRVDDPMPLPDDLKLMSHAEAVEITAFRLAQEVLTLIAEKEHALSVLDDALDRTRVRALWSGEIATLRERGRKMP